jgi:type II restriction/modification system DNA methylase subunit YeeA
MTLSVEEFIARYETTTLNERAAAQSHFLDLCELLEVPKPTQVDPHGDYYRFEKLAEKDSGSMGFADVWYQGHFAWEYKGPQKDLDAALAQVRQYAGALGNPWLLVVSDLRRIRVIPQFPNYVTTPVEFSLADLRKGEVREKLRNLWLNPEAWRPTLTRNAVTLEVAGQFATIADRLRASGKADPHRIAHYLIRILFCLFAENIELLPKKHFSTMLERFRSLPTGFTDRLHDIYQAMAIGGYDGNERIKHFNGGLFTNAEQDLIVPHPDDLRDFVTAAGADWSSVAPAIFGTLFERGLDPDKRSQIGAHYTGEDDIRDVVEPVVLAPLRRQWEETRAQLDELASKNRANSPKAQQLRNEMHYAIMQTTVLDPACGSGNFLYVTLRLLHDLEYELLTWEAQHQLQQRAPAVGPQQLFGIDINPYAAELAQAVIWIGHLQWMIEHGYWPTEPILQKLDNIVCRDALLDRADPAHPLRTAWPATTCIVSNPPFLGGNKVRAELGDSYVETLWHAYDGRVGAFADLVCYFVEQARVHLEARRVERVGLITTNSIRGGVNRQVIERIKATHPDPDDPTKRADLFMAWADRPWVLEGAAVRISLLGFDDGNEPSRTLDGHLVGTINSDLTSAIDLTQAKRLAENAGIGFEGTKKDAPFDIDSATAHAMLAAKGNPNGRPNSDVVKPWMNGSDIVRRPRDMWIIDFGVDMPMEEAALYEAPFEYTKKLIQPIRAANNRQRYRDYWWLHAEPRPGLRHAIAPLKRYILTPRVSKHRIFVWVDAAVIPDSATVAFARDDDYTFGVLHSHAHEVWSLRMCTWLGVGNDPRYTPTTTFETFPFPRPDGLQREAIAVAARTLVAQRDAWLNPPDADEAELKQRTLTNLYNARPQWLANAHATLDRAVYAAYGWPAEIGDEDLLARLLAENLSR